MSENISTVTTTEIQNLVAGGQFKEALHALDKKDVQDISNKISEMNLKNYVIGTVEEKNQEQSVIYS